MPLTACSSKDFHDIYFGHHDLSECEEEPWADTWLRLHRVILQLCAGAEE